MMDSAAPDAFRPSASSPPRADGTAISRAPDHWSGPPGHGRAPGRTPAAAGRRPETRSRREEILDGAAEMFAEHGYHGSSLRKIAAHVGVSHSGMLHHFSTKDDLLGAVIGRLEDHAQELLEDLTDLCTGTKALERGLGTSWHPGSHPIRLLATLDAEAVSRDHPGRFRLARLRRVHEHALEQCFLALEEHGDLRAEIDPSFASRSMLALILNHASREGTVRTMQHEDHGDAPVSDLHRLLHSFLRSAEDAGSVATVRPLHPEADEGA